jgi:hypothetical protein
LIEALEDAWCSKSLKPVSEDTKMGPWIERVEHQIPPHFPVESKTHDTAGTEQWTKMVCVL